MHRCDRVCVDLYGREPPKGEAPQMHMEQEMESWGNVWGPRDLFRDTRALETCRQGF